MNYPHLRGIPHCHKCGSEENLTLQRTTESGKKYFFCNPCNTERCRKWRNKGKNMVTIKDINSTYEKKNPERRAAWEKVKRKAIKKHPCQVCGEKKVHAHHPDPKKQLLVVHLCPLHHRQVHLGKIQCPEATAHRE